VTWSASSSRWSSRLLTSYSDGMSNPDTDGRPFVDVLAENGRPVSIEGLDRARRSLADARARRDPNARAALLERLRAA
jgi:hypothetical protein